MLNELLKHNVEDMDTFKKMSPGEQKMFMSTLLGAYEYLTLACDCILNKPCNNIDTFLTSVGFLAKTNSI